jgi:hypothetical protein
MAKIAIPPSKKADDPRGKTNGAPPSPKTPAEEIGALAYQLWQARGCPEGSAEDDWYRAEEELQGARKTDTQARAATS